MSISFVSNLLSDSLYVLRFLIFKVVRYFWEITFVKRLYVSTISIPSSDIMPGDFDINSLLCELLSIYFFSVNWQTKNKHFCGSFFIKKNKPNINNGMVPTVRWHNANRNRCLTCDALFAGSIFKCELIFCANIMLAEDCLNTLRYSIR